MKKLDVLMSNTSEIITVEELKRALEEGKPRAYIGFEPSGIAHIGWLICAGKIKDFIDCGFDFTVLLADWHAYINDKLGGNLESIRLCGRYMEECFQAMGIDRKKVRYLYASEYVSDKKYWETVLKVAKSISLARAKRAMDIMGRRAEDAEKDLSKLFYPAMQVADMFYLNVDVAYGGMDQRRAHVLAREVAEKLERKKPVAVHTPILAGLQAQGRMDPIEAKMSKSKPESMISIHDGEEEIRNKIRKAFCPEKEIHNNPVLEICKFIIFPRLDRAFLIERDAKFGGDVEFCSYEELENSFREGDIHPLDLKEATSKYLIEILKPIRRYFDVHPDILEEMKRLVEKEKR